MRFLARAWSLAVVCGLPAPVRSAAAQDPVIRDTAARSHLNQYVTLFGRVATSQRRSSGELWLSLGERYPRGPLVVVVNPEIVFEFPGVTVLRGREVRVQGRIISPTAESGERPIVPYIRIEDIGRLREVRPGDEVPPSGAGSEDGRNAGRGTRVKPRRR